MLFFLFNTCSRDPCTGLYVRGANTNGQRGTHPNILDIPMNQYVAADELQQVEYIFLFIAFVRIVHYFSDSLLPPIWIFDDVHLTFNDRAFASLPPPHSTPPNAGPVQGTRC